MPKRHSVEKANSDSASEPGASVSNSGLPPEPEAGGGAAALQKLLQSIHGPVMAQTDSLKHLLGAIKLVSSSRHENSHWLGIRLTFMLGCWEVKGEAPPGLDLRAPGYHGNSYRLFWCRRHISKSQPFVSGFRGVSYSPVPRASGLRVAARESSHEAARKLY